MTMFDFADCLDTLERNQAEVDALEAELAQRYRVEPSELVELDDAGLLDDSPLVADWRATKARLASWSSA
jgi:hypothetical protein